MNFQPKSSPSPKIKLILNNVNQKSQFGIAYLHIKFKPNHQNLSNWRAIAVGRLFSTLFPHTLVVSYDSWKKSIKPTYLNFTSDNMAVILPQTGYRELLLLLLRRRKRLKIVGESMLPLLQPGDEILVNPYAYQKSAPKIGDIVVATHPEQNRLDVVKRVTAIYPDGNYFLSGDNPKASTDSRHWGTVNSSNIIGKVTSYFL